MSSLNTLLLYPLIYILGLDLIIFLYPIVPTLVIFILDYLLDHESSSIVRSSCPHYSSEDCKSAAEARMGETVGHDVVAEDEDVDADREERKMWERNEEFLKVLREQVDMGRERGNGVAEEERAWEHGYTPPYD
ncbi:hypothetical protein K458DRAFT_383643 [Lentithecium fluviatile CBS 122367]|uniref:Uncharacterized protein n=1 Tax=Lentithecium fluviatile CBS 122367 TaxID=1168545 RepID=A0A6G1JJ86_9PLEO|nr:hypothetical protein K458DRAFT_383643 [Lentithecium fluviatile CBS 122367]